MKKIHGYTRKKLYVVSFLLGVFIVAFAWIYTTRFSVICKVNGMPVYAYQLREYQKREYTDIKDVLINDVLKTQFLEKEGNESFEEFKSQSQIVSVRY